MQSALRMTASVQAGGKIEVINPELPAGEQVDIIVLFSQVGKDSGGISVLDVLDSAPGHLIFQSAEDVDAFIRDGRSEWDD